MSEDELDNAAMDLLMRALGLANGPVMASAILYQAWITILKAHFPDKVEHVLAGLAEQGKIHGAEAMGVGATKQ